MTDADRALLYQLINTNIDLMKLTRELQMQNHTLMSWIRQQTAANSEAQLIKACEALAPFVARA